MLKVTMTRPGSQLDFNPGADKSLDLTSHSALRSRSTAGGSHAAWAHVKAPKSKFKGGASTGSDWKRVHLRARGDRSRQTLDAERH